MPTAFTDYATPQALAFANLNQGLSALGQGIDDYRKRQAADELGKLALTGDYNGAAARAFASGDAQTGLGLLALGRELDASKQADAILNGTGGAVGASSAGGSGGSASSGAAGGSPSFAGGKSAMRMPADPEVERRFVDTLKAGGLTNPYGLAAMAAYANAESGYAPQNVSGSWSDPSQSGMGGTSGGILSWRNERLDAMRKMTAGAKDPVSAQAKFALVENPDLTMALQSAKSPEEANRLMAQAWRFAGYDKPGGELARREALTRAYVSRLGGDQPTQVASAANAPSDVFPGATMSGGQPDPFGAPGTTSTAMLPRSDGGFVPVPPPRTMLADAAPAAQGAQTAQASPADLPAEGATPTQAAGFRVPGSSADGLPPLPAQTQDQINRLQKALSVPGLSPQTRQVLQQRLTNIETTARQYQSDVYRQQAEERRAARDDLRKTATPVTDPQERARLGIPESFKGPVTVDGYGNISAPLKALAEVTVKNEGTIPAGYEVERDAEGRPLRMKPITGSPAATEAADVVEKKAKQLQQVEQTGNSVFNALDDIDRIMSTSRFPVTGGIGKTLAQIPGTNAHDVSSALNTVKANISFERLNQMRQASPTGGALGAVSDSEQKLLSGSLAALEQSQSQEQFQRNLRRARATFERVVHGKVLSPEERASMVQTRDSASAPPSQPAATAPPKVGHLDSGYRFKGGDPADPKNWVKVQ